MKLPRGESTGERIPFGQSKFWNEKLKRTKRAGNLSSGKLRVALKETNGLSVLIFYRSPPRVMPSFTCCVASFLSVEIKNRDFHSSSDKDLQASLTTCRDQLVEIILLKKKTIYSIPQVYQLSKSIIKLVQSFKVHD